MRDLAFNDASSACRNHLGFYFNAGVLLLDMEKWRESKAGERLFALLEARPQITQGFHDQNLLNECFFDEVCELPLRWNVIVAPPHILRFADKDSACSDKSAIASSTLRLRTPSARPCVDSQSPDLLKKPAAASPCTASLVFSSTILESQSSSENHKSCREQTSLESTFAQSSHSPTAIPRILEEENQSSLRASAVAVARQSTLESSVQVDSMDSKETSTNAERYPLFCHADFQSARNDDENTQSSNTPQARANLDSSKSPSDSKIFTQNAKNLSKLQAEAVEMRNRGFQGVGAGIYLGDNEQARAVESTIYRSSATPPSPKPSPQVKVSIIVPVFNTQAYITRCLDSLISQSLRDIEIIIVDDCGSDGAMSIAQEFAARDPRIHILHNLKNLGLLHTRCVGAAVAKGEYILYVDSDDYIKPNLCELCYERARESKADMVVFGSECRGFYRYVYQPKGSRIYTGSALSKLIFPTRSKFSPYLWNKLYKRELIAKADSIISRVAGPITLAEDLLKAFVLLRLSSTAATLPSKLYIYCANASSSTSSCKDRAQSRAKALEDIRAYGRVAQALAFCASELACVSCELYDKFDRVLRYLVLCKRAQTGGYISNMWASLFVWFRIESLAKIMLHILSFGKIAR